MSNAAFFDSGDQNFERRMEDFILQAPISERRKKDFLLDYLRGRQQCGALEAAFEQDGALLRESSWDDANAIGFNVLALKGPFVDESNYALYEAWQFALALERSLLTKLEETLQSQSTFTDPTKVTPNWRRMFAKIDELSVRVDAGLGFRRLVIVAGELHDHWLVNLTKQEDVAPDWDLPSELNRTWILGAYQGSLILHIAEATRRAIYVVGDVRRFARLTAFGDPQIEINPVDDEAANRLMTAGYTGTKRELKLRVQLKLYESWRLEVAEQPRVATAEIEG
jgi:hypothetical protein